MKNKSGFVPMSAPIQPLYYRNIFNAWCAVYIDDNNREFHLQLVLDPWSWQNGYSKARGIEILMQCPTHRAHVCVPTEFKTIKAALKKVESVLSNHSDKSA